MESIGGELFIIHSPPAPSFYSSSALSVCSTACGVSVTTRLRRVVFYYVLFPVKLGMGLGDCFITRRYQERDTCFPPLYRTLESQERAVCLNILTMYMDE